MTEVIFLNGKFIPPEEAKISVLEPGFLYGWGLFETMRSYQGRIVYFDAHLERIKQSSRLLGIDSAYSQAELKKIIKKTGALNKNKDACVRLSLYKTKDGAITLVVARKYQPYGPGQYREGLKVCISSFRQGQDSFLSRLKTTNYLFYQLAYQEAKKKGFEEAVIMNNRGYLCEGARTNLFFVKNKQIFTPSLECGCLDGITRRVIFDLAKKHHLKIYAGKFTPPELYAAEEAFLSNSLMGIMPIASLEREQIGKHRPGEISSFLIQRYNSLLKNGI